MGTGVGNMRATDYRKSFWTRARRVSHVFQDSSILHMKKGCGTVGLCRMHLSSLAHVSLSLLGCDLISITPAV